MAQIFLVEVTGKKQSRRWFVVAESSADAIQTIKDSAEAPEHVLMTCGNWKAEPVGKTLQLVCKRQVRRKT